MEQTVLQIQSGDEALRNPFIAECQGRVALSASRHCRRYIDPSQDGEFTIALAAFGEAIDRYKPSKEESFMEFADKLIAHRLSEYLARSGKLMPLIGSAHAEKDAIEKPPGQRERSGELQELAEVLGQFGISFGDLADQSPQDREMRDLLFEAGYALAQDAGLMRLMLKNRKLPVKELLARIEIPRKVVERHQAYIAMIAFLYNGPFPYLREYWRMEPVSAGDWREKDV